MRKLLSTNFSRIWQSRVFWLGMAAMCGSGIFAVIMRYRDILEDPSYAYTTADDICFLGGLYVSVALSVFILAMLLGSITVHSMLTAPEYHENNFQMSVNGEIVQGDPILNPKYLRGMEREIYQFIQDFQPAGQMMQFNAGDNFPEHIGRFPAYSLMLAVLTTGIGYVLFCQKDIK